MTPAPQDHLVGEPIDPETVFVRFDVHQRLQHGLIASSFITLVLTGWPLTTHGIGSSRSLVDLFGGLEGCALIHRVAGVLMACAALYHLGYLAVRARQRKLALTMFPSLKDAFDIIGNLAYFVGLRSERPRFPRFTYYEKFDYWAVFWGVAIMVGSGLIRWFPEDTTALTSPIVYEIGLHAHADEALLAALAIFVWHFYNVHLRPQIFPMSWVFITGRMTAAELEEEHGEEYDQLVERARKAAAAAEVKPAPEPATEVKPAPEPAAEVKPAPEPATEVKPTPGPAAEVKPTPPPPSEDK